MSHEAQPVGGQAMMESGLSGPNSMIGYEFRLPTIDEFIENYPGGIPLNDKIPFGTNIEVGGELAKTCLHEWKHVSAAINLGVPIESVSVIPAGDGSLGRVTLGDMTRLQFNIIAAAAASFDPVGAGSDLQKVYLNGGSVDEARRLGDVAGRYFHPDIDSIAIGILGMLGEIDGSEIDAVVARANIERIRMKSQYLPVWNTDLSEKTWDDMAKLRESAKVGERMRNVEIITYPDHIKTTYIDLQGNYKEELICRHCGMRYTVEHTCLNNSQGEKSIGNDQTETAQSLQDADGYKENSTLIFGGDENKRRGEFTLPEILHKMKKW